jgi:NSS family neurotransmitter:Na+ symporter
MAVGTGNIWRFPREVAQNGGGPFLIAWTVAMLIWAVPILAAELVVGRKTRLGTIGAFRDFVGRKFTWMGTWVGLVCILIMAYYSVVTGWCIKYLALALSGAFKSGMTTDQTKAIWDGFTASGIQPVIFHAMAIGIAGFIVYMGVNKGIEKACKVMIPTLFLLLVFAAIRVLFLPGAVAGYEFLFSPKWEMLLKSRVWVEAFTQASWSTGAGWGLLLTYAVYTKAKEDVAGNALIIGLGDNIGALLAGLVVLPAIFALSPSIEVANEIAVQGGTGLTFIFLAQLFGTMAGGQIIAVVFFAALTLAALSSLIPMVEVGVLNLIDLGMSRKKALIATIAFGLSAGIPSALNMTFFNNQDTVTGYALWISGMFFVYAVIKYGAEKVRKEEINTPWTDFDFGRWFTACLYLAPLFSFWLLFDTFKALLGQDNKWQVIGTDWSFATIMVQFGAYLLIGFLTMNFFNNKIGKGVLPDMEADEEGGVHNVR